MVAAAAAASASSASTSAAASSGWVSALLPHSVVGAVLYALVLGVAVALYHFRARRLHCAGADTVPSPGFVFWFGHFLTLQKERARMYDWVSELSNVTYRGKHWQMSVPGSPVAIVAAPSEAVTKLLLKDDFQNWIVSDRRKAWTEELFGHGIFGVNGPEWLRQRKAASSVFTLRLLRDGMTPVFEEHSAVVVRILREAAKSGKAVDLQDLFFRYTMDSFCQIAFGEDVGCLKQPDRPHPFASAFDRVQYGVMTRVFDLLWKAKRALGIGQEKKMVQDVAVINEYAKVFVQHRRQDLADGKVRNDLISHFMAWAKKEGRDMTDQELRDVIINFLVAGRDTTAVAMSWFFYEMHKHPAALAKVVAEVDALMAEHGTAIANFEVARDMQYTEAALLESLRLHPSVPVEGRMCLREAQLPATATQPAMTLPAGTAVVYHPYTYGRSPELWGPDAAEYKPERWLADSTAKPDAAAAAAAVDAGAAADGDSKSAAGGAGVAGVEFNDSTNLKRHSQWKFPTFNAGMRLCMGRGLALHEAKLLIASILHSLTLTLAPNHPPVTYQLTVTLMLKDGIRMLPALRADRPAAAATVASATAKAAAPAVAAH